MKDRYIFKMPNDDITAFKDEHDGHQFTVVANWVDGIGVCIDFLCEDCDSLPMTIYNEEIDDLEGK